MSSFMIGNKSISNLAVFLNGLYNYGYNTMQMGLVEEQRKALEDACKECATDSEIITNQYVNEKNLFKALYKMNQIALNERYNEPEQEPELPANFPSVQTVLGNKYQLFKTMKCYLYQCCEGKVVTSNLYIELNKVVNILATNIVCGTKEFNDAIWG